MHNVCWNHSWAEGDRGLCCIRLDYRHYYLLFSITLTVIWQLLLVSCNAKLSSCHVIIALLRVLVVSYINDCVESLG